MNEPVLLGIVRNPKSRRNRDRPAPDAAHLGSHVLLREPRTPEALRAVCAEFAGAGVGVLAIDGGDGTVRDVLSAATETFATLPPLAFLASGKTNILAASSGTWGTGGRALERLAGAAATGMAEVHATRLTAMRVVAGERRLLGFVIGTGAYAKAIALADRGLADRISLGPARIAAGIGRGVLTLARTEERGRWLAGAPMRVAADGHGAEQPHPRMIFLATTLRRFTLGLWPFWNHDERPLRFLDVDGSPPRLGAALLPALRGRPKPWMKHAGYRSGSASRILLHLHDPFVLDGEAYEPGPDGTVTVEAGPAIEFLAPR